ncbi:MAG: protein arginine kinase [Tissierellia bacterium]|nr:protein arginine kinase [Tissierellia bacterium]
MTKWLEGPATDLDVVISTRVRVARNLEHYKFPDLMTVEESDDLTDEILNAIKNSDEDENYRFIRIRDLNPRERLVFIEEHLISPGLIQNLDKSSFLIRNDERATIMINEEDHIRIQTLFSGLKLLEGWELCSQIDDNLEQKIDYAFDEKLGFLTSCPTNVGTGLRASVMVHLPCLSMTGHINTIIEALRKVGLTVRGLYGEGSEALGNLYQISNQITLGESEEEIIKKLNKVINQIVARERNTRRYLLETKKLELEDKIYRSLGILTHSRLMSSKEAMNHLSNIKLGWDINLIQNDKFKEIVKLMIDIQPANIQKTLEKDMPSGERDNARAEIIRTFIENMEE